MYQIIYDCFFAVIFQYILVTIIVKLNNEKIGIKNYLIYIFTIGIISGLIGHLTYINSIELFISAIISSFLLWKLIKLKLRTAIIFTLLTYFIGTLIDVIVAIIFTSLFKYTIEFIKTSFVLYLVFHLAMFLLLQILFKIKIVNNFFSKIGNSIKIFEGFNFKKSIIPLIYIITTIGLISLNDYILKFVPDTASKYIILFNSLVYIVYFVVNMFVINMSKKYVKQNFEYENLKIYTNIIEDLSNESRRFRHDFTNMLISLEGYLKNDDINGLKKYYNGLLNESKKMYSIKNAAILQHIKDSGLKGLLGTKIYEAERLNLNIDLNVFNDINDVKIETYHLCRMLGILLDNAKEAALNSVDKTISIRIIENEECVVFSISNSFNNDVNLENIFKEGYSTKGNNRGIGLSNLLDIKNKYDNILLNTFIENNMFKQEINIYK